MEMIAESISGFLSESNGKQARAVVSVIVRSVPGVGAGVVHVQADSETGRGGRSAPSCHQRADPLQICKNYLWWPSYSHRGPFDLSEYVEAVRLHLHPIVSSKSLL